MQAGSEGSDDIEPQALAGLLRWYVAMGADAAVADTPRDRFAQAAEQAPPRRVERASQLPLAASLGSAEDLIAQAQETAAGAQNLVELGQRWAAIEGCGLSASAAAMIFGGGALEAPLMIVGGAPDSDDERQSAIFAGDKGKLLDAMLRAIGLDRDRVYCSNVLPWRPPGNRAPTPLELALCLPFSRRQIALAKPKLVLCLGERAAQPLLGSAEPLSRLRGRWLVIENEAATMKTLVTYSLDFLIKQPLQKRRAWADLQMIRDVLSPASS